MESLPGKCSAPPSLPDGVPSPERGPVELPDIQLGRRKPFIVRQHHRSFNLAFRDGPVFFEQPIFFRRGYLPKAVFLIEDNGPNCRRPGPNQNRPGRRGAHMLQQVAANALIPEDRAHISVSDERDILGGLNSHHPGQFFVQLHSPENHTPFHLLLQFGGRHVGFVPAVFGNDTLVGLGCIVDDFPNHPKLIRATWAYHPIFLCRHGSTNYSTGTPNALDADWMALFFSVCSSSARFRASSLASRTAFSAAFKRSLTFLASSGVNAG